MDKNVNVTFSIIMPAYNVEEFISESINSVLGQTYKHFELIIVDDGSTDHTNECEEYYSKLDKRIVVLKQNNLGPAPARNNGMNHAKNDYIVFVDSDDLLEEDALEKLNKAIQKNEYPDVVVFGGKCYPETSSENWVERSLTTRNITYSGFKPDLIFKEKGTRPFIWQSCIKREFLNKNNLRINEKLVLGEDQAFQFAYFPLAKKVTCIENKLYNYRTNRQGSLMSGFNKAPLIKIIEHFRQINLIIKTWEDNGMKTKYPVELCEFTIKFLGYSILELPSIRNKKTLSKQLISLVNSLVESPYLMSSECVKLYNSLEKASEIEPLEKEELEKLETKISELEAEYNSLINSQSYKVGKFFSKKTKE